LIKKVVLTGFRAVLVHFSLLVVAVRVVVTSSGERVAVPVERVAISRLA
jgi:hypothetical protein